MTVNVNGWKKKKKMKVKYVISMEKKKEQRTYKGTTDAIST